MTAAASEVDVDECIAPPRAAVSEASVLEHRRLVRHIARLLVRRTAGNVELDDLVQAGMVGLLEAAQRYTGREGASFESFAAHRIRGAMFDFLRDIDWSPRSLRRRVRDIEVASRRIEVDTCEAARPHAIAAALGLPLEAYYRAIRDSNWVLVVSLDEEQLAGRPFTEPVDQNRWPDEELEHDEAISAVIAGIDALSDFDYTIFWLYYEEEYLMREIGDILALSESRVCQILKRIIERLRIATRSDLSYAPRLRGAFTQRPQSPELSTSAESG
jgi:RNA polymerase sigma factor for flagellar operon FliA